MKKYSLVMLVLVGLFAGVYILNADKKFCSLPTVLAVTKTESPKNFILDDGLALLKSRKDNQALLIFEQILARQPDNIDASWGKAEVLRRNRQFSESENILLQILARVPNHHPSLISLSYIYSKNDRLKEAIKLINSVLRGYPNKENQALAYLMLGNINSRRSAKGGFLNKITYGTHIKGYFLKAAELAPDLPEVHLGLGTFYLLAPVIAGGDLNRAFCELVLAVRLAPDFATANARLAQAYIKKGDRKKYDFYIKRVKELDPENEVLKEMDAR